MSEAAAAVGRDGGWLRRAIRTGRIPAMRSAEGYLLRRRDVERLDRTAKRRAVARAEPDEDAATDANDAEAC